MWLLHVCLGDVSLDIRELFWIARARQLGKRFLSACRIFKIFRAQNVPTKSPQIHLKRIRECKLFELIGLDFEGSSFFLNNSEKPHLILITFAVSRAIHLEFLVILARKTVLLVIRKSTARRGVPPRAYSGNPLIFRKARNKFPCSAMTSSKTATQDYCSQRRITCISNDELAAWGIFLGTLSALSEDSS